MKYPPLGSLGDQASLREAYLAKIEGFRKRLLLLTKIEKKSLKQLIQGLRDIQASARTRTSGIPSRKQTLLENKYEIALPLTAELSRFKKQLASLCEDHHYKFTLKRSSRNQLLIRVVADTTLWADSRKIKSTRYLVLLSIYIFLSIYI